MLKQVQHDEAKDRHARYRRMPSSVLRRYTYDPAAKRLDIEFVSGRRYSYHDVPERVWNRLLAATSKGSFFNRRIRDHFRFTREDKRGSDSA